MMPKSSKFLFTFVYLHSQSKLKKDFNLVGICEKNLKGRINFLEMIFLALYLSLDLIIDIF